MNSGYHYSPLFYILKCFCLITFIVRVLKWQKVGVGDKRQSEFIYKMHLSIKAIQGALRKTLIPSRRDVKETQLKS